jgi:hypothetical protein
VATPLSDAMVRFFKEFVVEEESPSTQQQSQPATGGISGGGEEKKDENVDGPFDPTYLYDAIKMSQLEPFARALLCSRSGLLLLICACLMCIRRPRDAEEFFRRYLQALDEELPTLLASISGRPVCQRCT